MPFSDYKKNRSKVAEALDKKLDDLNSNPFEDDRFWNLSVDKMGNGSALIRWLPAMDGEDVPFVQLWKHAFKGPGGWYIENCLTTTGSEGKQMGECPVCVSNRGLWNSEIEANRDIVRGKDKTPGRKRKLVYISNILVINDPEHPENNGKVFLFKYGAKLFEKIQEARSTDIADEDAINPFDMYEGANFKLICKDVKGYWNYDSSKFTKPGPVDKDENKMEEIYNSLYSLQEFITPDKFKSERDLKTRLSRVLGNEVATSKNNDDEEIETNVEPEHTPSKSRKAKSQPKVTADDEAPFEMDNTSDDDTMAMFKKLAED